MQRNAMKAWDENRDFRSLLEDDPDLGDVPADVLEQAFDLRHAVRHAGLAVDALDDLQP